MFAKLSYFLLLFIIPTLILSEPKCHMIEVERCFDKLHQLKEAHHDPSHLLTSAEGLNRICRTIKVDFVGCILSYLQKCGTPLHKELSKILSDSILEHMEQICAANSDMRNEIISVSPCVHEKVLSQRPYQSSCNNPFFTQVAWGEMKAHSPHPERAPLDYIIDAGCCAYRKWEDCSMPKVKDKCSPAGVKVLRTVMEKLLGGVPDFMCSKSLFSTGGKICRALPDYEKQKGLVNITYHENQKFSLFALIKLFLIRDPTSR